MTLSGNLLFLQDSKRLVSVFLVSIIVHLAILLKPFSGLSSSSSLRLLGRKGGPNSAQEVSFFSSVGRQSSAQWVRPSQSQVTLSPPSQSVSSESSGPSIRGMGQGGTATDYSTTLHAYIDSVKVFPRTLKELGLSGTVRVRFTVSRDGFLKQIEVADSGAPKILQAEALRFLQKLERVPVPPPSLTNQDLQFELPLRYELTG